MEKHELTRAIGMKPPAYQQVGVSQLDAHPFLVCTSDGLAFDLEKRVARPLTPRDYITKAFGARWDPSAKCPRWERFLKEIFLDDKALIAYFRRLVGYCLTGDVREQKFWVLWGEGSNGKSVLVEVLGRLFDGYYVILPAELFLAQQHPSSADSPSPTIASLKGARLAIGSETGEGRRLNEPLLKRLSGGDKLTARLLYAKQALQFPPTHKLFLVTNHKPRLSPKDGATWRRLRLIPFRAKFEGESVDKGLADKLLSELPGILVWAINGALEWREGGLGEEPECVREAVEEYKREVDPVARFISETCETALEHRESARSLLLAYNQWAAGEGEREATPQWFGRRMKEMGHVASHGESGTLYRDLRLLPSWRVSSGYQGGAPEDSPE